MMTREEEILELQRLQTKYPMLTDDAKDYGNWHAFAHIDKWQPQTMDQITHDLGLVKPQKAELLALGIQPDAISESDGNALLTAGITRLLNLLIAAGGQGLDHTHSRIGTGDGSTGVTIADTDLSAVAGSTHRWFNVSDVSNPSVATNVLTDVSTFATGDGNYAWNEWGIDAGTASGNTVTAPLLNRKVPGSSLGTKAAGATWAFTVTITVS